MLLANSCPKVYNKNIKFAKKGTQVMNTQMNFYFPTRLITGRGCVRASGGALAAVGKKPLIVTGRRSAKLCGALDDVLWALAGTPYALFDGIEQNPTVASCMEAASLARVQGCDYVIGIGGGSPLDAAKAVAVLAADPALEEKGLFAGHWPMAPWPIVCVGTTAGTGSEVTPVSVLTTGEGRKKSIRADSIFPTLSLGDPAYTQAMSPTFTVSTAVDALSHCLESYFNTTANHISRSFAREGVKTMLPALRILARQGAAGLCEADRDQLYAASLYGGLAISVTGTALCHAMGYFLSEAHGVPHGQACGAFLPEFLVRTHQAKPEDTEAFLSSVGLSLAELLTLCRALTTVKVSLAPRELEELAPRWVNNKSIEKSLFAISGQQCTRLLEDLWGENGSDLAKN